MNQNTEPAILPEMTKETAMLIEYFCKELGYIKEAGNQGKVPCVFGHLHDSWLYNLQTRAFFL